MVTEHLVLPVDDAGLTGVTAALHVADEVALPGVVLVPGAGGTLDGDGLVALADVLCEAGAAVVRANLPYREAGRRAPRADRTIPGLVQVVDAARPVLAEHGGPGPLVVGGKSYGGRVATMAVADGALGGVAGLLLYGYPLHPPGKPDAVRTDHWSRIDVPCCFLQGTRDVFGGPDELTPHLASLGQPATVVRVEGGDHSLRITRSAAPDGVARGEGAAMRSDAVRPHLLGWIRDYGSWPE